MTEKEYEEWSLREYHKRLIRLDEAHEKAKSNPFTGLITIYQQGEVVKVL